MSGQSDPVFDAFFASETPQFPVENHAQTTLEGFISLTLDSRGGVTQRMVTAYCVKCKTKREMKNPKKVKMKNGKPATKGECPKCGTTLYRIGG